MDWIFDNFQVVVALVVVVFWILRSIAGGDKSDETPAPGPGRSAKDPADAERTRQIQEEIRRRILARQQGQTTTAPPTVPVPAAEVAQERAETYHEEDEPEEFLEEGPRAPMPTAAARRMSDEAQAILLEQQRQLAEQLHALRAARAAGSRGASLPSIGLPGAAAAMAAHQRSCRRELLRDLRGPASLRRAILLKEILGAPLALQRGREIPRR